MMSFFFCFLLSKSSIQWPSVSNIYSKFVPLILRAKQNIHYSLIIECKFSSEICHEKFILYRLWKELCLQELSGLSLMNAFVK